MLVDLRPKRTTGKAAEQAWSAPTSPANKNAIPFDPEKPAITSGIRLGTPAATTRGFGTAEFREVGQMIGEVLDGLAGSNDGTNEDRGGGGRGARPRHVPAFPGLRERALGAGHRDALPVLWTRGHGGQGFRVRQRTGRRSAAAGRAAPAASVSPRSSASSSARSRSSRRDGRRVPFDRESSPAPFARPDASARWERSGSSGSSTASSATSKPPATATCRASNSASW